MTVRPEKPLRAGWIASGLLLAGAVGVMYAVAVLFGDLNQDEGWYLYAGRLVSEGKHPFRDFASTQGPLMAYVYRLAYPLVRLAGVTGGRLFTALFGVLTVVLAARLARRMVLADDGVNTAGGGAKAAANTAGLLAAGLLGLNLYHVYFTSLVKTYGLAGFLTLLGFVGLECALRAAGRHTAAKNTCAGRAVPVAAFGFGMLAAACFGAAAGTRLSAGILLPAVWLPLLVVWLRTGRGCGTGGILAGMLVGGTAAVAAVYGPFLWMAPDALAFGLLDYHAGRQVGGVPLLLAYKVGFILRLCSFYFPVLVVGAIGLAGAGRGLWCDGSPVSLGNREVRSFLPRLMVSGLVAVTLVHLAAPFPYDDYQVFVMPCAVLLAVLPGVRLLFRLSLTSRRRVAIVAGALLLMLAHSLSSPLLQTWLLAGRDRIWWPLKTQTALQGLHRAAALVRQQMPTGAAGDAVLLTQDTYLAVEADMHVPPGMELGPFCLFPELSNEEAARYHVLNEAMLIDRVEHGEAGVAVFSDWGLAIRSPAIQPVEPETVQRIEQALCEFYEPVSRVEKFGQGETSLRLLKRREQP